MKTAIIGGGAAGFFCAVNIKEMLPEMDVVIFERSRKVLSKVAISGGGRCNCSNSFDGVKDLSEVYPRGHRLMKRLFHVFDYNDAYSWFERHGVRLVTQDDNCVFPAAQDSGVVIDCFQTYAKRFGVDVRMGHKVESLDDVRDYDFIVVTTGGSPSGQGLRWLMELGHEIVSPVPSLFTFAINDDRMHSLMGLVKDVAVHISGTKYYSEGPMLITHWGVSGPAILKLSSYAARFLSENGYFCPLSVNWLVQQESDVRRIIDETMETNGKKQVLSYGINGFSNRLWQFVAERALGKDFQKRWAELNKKEINRLVNTLTNDVYQISGRAKFKDEFVTCGGVSLTSVNPSTLESKHVRHLYFAGEVLDIDGITGGFNFQAAWTTGYTVAKSICQEALM